MGRYVQKVSLFPFSADEVWVGWDLEGLEGSIDGLVRVEDLATDDGGRIERIEFQAIPAEYLADFRGGLS